MVLVLIKILVRLSFYCSYSFSVMRLLYENPEIPTKTLRQKKRRKKEIAYNKIELDVLGLRLQTVGSTFKFPYHLRHSKWNFLFSLHKHIVPLKCMRPEICFKVEETEIRPYFDSVYHYN